MIKHELFEAAKSIGIDKIGVAQIDGETIVVALFPYYAANERGNIAMYARARDYHKVNSEKLTILCDFLKANGAKKCDIFVDNAARNDREAALAAGLGFFGRNNLLICDEYGSFFTIGQIVTDLFIEPDLPSEQKCESCDRCASACPTKALCGGFNKLLCLSEITQKRGKLTEQEQKLLTLNDSIWGCDACQLACPHNRQLRTNVHPELMQNRVANLTPNDICALTESEFVEKYGEYAFSWRGLDVLKRNIMLQKCNF